MNAKWISLGFRIYPLITMAIAMVEKVVKAKGKEKQDAAVEAVGAGIELLEAGMGRDIVENAEVQGALRSAIDAIVHLQNVIAKARAKN